MLPPEEWHEIGLHLANYIIRARGYETIYLGQNVPFENVASVLKYTKPSHIVMFFVARKNEEDLRQLRKRMGLSVDIKLLAAGSSDAMEIIKTEKNTSILTSPHDLLKFL